MLLSAVRFCVFCVAESAVRERSLGALSPAPYRAPRCRLRRSTHCRTGQRTAGATLHSEGNDERAHTFRPRDCAAAGAVKVRLVRDTDVGHGMQRREPWDGPDIQRSMKHKL